MARTTFARLIATPDSTDQDLEVILEKFEAQFYRIKRDHLLVREKIALQLARMRKKNSKADTLDIKHGLIAILDAIYDSFNDLGTRNKLIEELDRLLARLSKHHQHDGFSKSARHTFTWYFHKLIKKQEKLTDGFFSWFEAYAITWQTSHVFGKEFDFNRWKTANRDEQHESSALSHHFELLKNTSVILLENYLGSVNVGYDRHLNAEWLLNKIRDIPADASSFASFQRALNLAKKRALEWDADIDKHRISFFRRHRFGSRYIALLDDLRERALFCQCQERRDDFLQGELADYNELKTHRDARVDNDHATRYLAKQVEDKEKMMEAVFDKFLLPVLR